MIMSVWGRGGKCKEENEENTREKMLLHIATVSQPQNTQDRKYDDQFE